MKNERCSKPQKEVASPRTNHCLFQEQRELEQHNSKLSYSGLRLLTASVRVRDKPTTLAHNLCMHALEEGGPSTLTARNETMEIACDKTILSLFTRRGRVAKFQGRHTLLTSDLCHRRTSTSPPPPKKTLQCSAGVVDLKKNVEERSG